VEQKGNKTMEKVKRVTSIHFRVTPEEKTAVERLAVKQWSTPSEYIRELIRQEIKKQGVSLTDLGVARDGQPRNP
jgi:predicted DNA-binding protein